MSTLLEIHSSINGERSASSMLVRTYVDAWRGRNADGRVISRDVYAEPLPHLDAERFGAFITPPAERDARQQEHVASSDALIEELRLADTIALGLPMYNFSVPSALKAWMDHVARAGETFRYTENGPVGLLEGKRAIVFAARGGRYAGTDADSQTPFVRTFLGFLGIKDVKFIYAEGLAMGDGAREESLDAALDQIRGLFDIENAA